ncbi:tumor necrosis factor receptor superfamily member 12A [Gopherus flavomarginatus]|uniref:tumor necrosis factor receptor superfamily member 12A n=1 Tax=Gopherus flavomarginatus TaxID=286002 RepID=UPI0021CC1BC7|nr:tumor necrosis factor receptor superfamily member 12A [Gopherus flavomarginatus]
METRGKLAMVLLVLLGVAWGEPAAGPSCPGGQSWSPDLDKCMDCTICLHRTKNDFCATCGEPQPQDSRLWLAVGGTMGGVAVLGLVGGALLWARCRKREKFTTPIEETGGHSGEESLID